MTVADRLYDLLLVPTVMVIWGATMLSMAFVKDFNGLVAARFILGLAESPLFPSVCFYLSTWYPRHEMVSQRIL